MKQKEVCRSINSSPSMGAEAVRSYLTNKFTRLLKEAPGPSQIVSRFRSIEEQLKSETSSSFPIDPLYDLIHEVSEYNLFARRAASFKKGVYWFRMLWFNKKMKRQLDEIEKNLNKPESLRTDPPSSPISNRDLMIQQTCLVQDPPLVVGFESEAKIIEGWLLSDKICPDKKKSDKICRVGIVGSCGSGKTALAQKVFNSLEIQGEFYPRIWVSLSIVLGDSKGEMGVRVLNGILKKIEEGHDAVVPEVELDSSKVEEEVRSRLKGKRYLIVFDDVRWIDNSLFRGLPEESGGPRGAVIATSRRENGISEDPNYQVIRLKPTNDKIVGGILSDVSRRLPQAWSAWTQNEHLFQGEQDIIACCHGLPLAANALASIIAGDGPRIINLEDFKQSWAWSFWIPARELLIIWGNDTTHWRWISLPLPLPADGFYLSPLGWISLPPPADDVNGVEEVAELGQVHWLEIRGRLELKKLLKKTSYSAYLVFKLRDGNYGLSNATAQVRLCSKGEKVPLTNNGKNCSEVFIDGKNGEGRSGFPQPWGKEWVEIKLGEFFSVDEEEEVDVALHDMDTQYAKSGLIVKGIHFRPNCY